MFCNYIILYLEAHKLLRYTIIIFWKNQKVPKMEKIVNWIQTLIPALLVIAITLIVILFAKGWRINVGERTIIPTGILDINSEPRGATIYINGEDKGKTPKVITSLTPGEYSIELRKEGSVKWSKHINIKPEYVSKIEANLFNEESLLTQATERAVDEIYFKSDGGEAITITLHNGNPGIYKTRLDSNFFTFQKDEIKISNLLVPETFNLTNSNFTLIPNKNFSYTLLKISAEDNLDRYFLINLNEENSTPKEISEYLQNREQISWGKDNQSLILEKGSVLSIYNIINQTENVITHWEKGIWTEGQNKIFFLSENPLTKEIEILYADKNGENRTKIEAEAPEDIFAMYFNEEYQELLLSYPTRIARLNSRNHFTEEEEINISNSAVISISPNERYFIISEQEEGTEQRTLYSYDFEEEESKQFVGEQIESAMNWSPNSQRIFYRYTDVETGINRISSTDPDGANAYTLLEIVLEQRDLDDKIGFSSDSDSIFVPLYTGTNLTADSEQIDEEIDAIVVEDVIYIYKMELR